MTRTHQLPAGRTEAELVKRFDNILAPYHRSDAPGLVVGVSLAQSTLYRRGVGLASLETRLANSPSTRMRIGSVTKHFTCALALILNREDKFDLDAPIGSYIPELPGSTGRPTIRELMLHRGGLRCHTDVGLICHGLTPSPAGTAMKFYTRPQGVNFQPGDAMIYNNGGYFLLSRAIERAADIPFDTLLTKRLFRPLGMQDTDLISSDYVITPGIATMHIALDDNRWRRGLFVSEEMCGAGGIVSTVDDMLRWMIALDTGFEFINWITLTEPPGGVSATSDYYSFGLQVANYRGVKTISHSGGVIGGSSQMITVPKYKLNIIVNSNGAPEADPTLIAEQIIDAVLEEELLEKEPPLAASGYQQFIGDWWSEADGLVFNIRNDEGALKLHAFGGDVGVDLKSKNAAEIFYFESGFRDLTFSIIPNSNDAINVSLGEQPIVLQRIKPQPPYTVALNQDAIGKYFSSDANALAIIQWEDDLLQIRLSDDVGTSISPLNQISDHLTYAGPFAGLISCTLTFEYKGDRISGFILNSVRTRHLSFEKISETP